MSRHPPPAVAARGPSPATQIPRRPTPAHHRMAPAQHRMPTTPLPHPAGRADHEIQAILVRRTAHLARHRAPATRVTRRMARDHHRAPATLIPPLDWEILVRHLNLTRRAPSRLRPEIRGCWTTCAVPTIRTTIPTLGPNCRGRPCRGMSMSGRLFWDAGLPHPIAPEGEPKLPSACPARRLRHRRRTEAAPRRDGRRRVFWISRCPGRP